MRRFTFRIAVALLTFIVGVAAASVFMVSRIAEVEEPPCHECLELYASSEIPTVTLRKLQSKPEEYRGKLIRVREIFHHDAGAIHLLSARESGGGAMYAGIADSGGACAGSWKALTIYSGYRTWYDSDANVVAVGRCGRIEGERNFYRGYDGFNILCLERVEPIGSGIGHRIYYTIGRVADAIF